MAEEQREPDGTQPVDLIARLLNLTPRRVQQLAKQGHIPRAARGRYDLVPTVQGYCRYMQELLAGKGESQQQKYEADIARERAEKLKRENAVARGELVKIDAVGTAVEDSYARCRARLLAIPGNVAASCTGETDPNIVQTRVMDEIAEALNELSYEGPGETQQANSSGRKKGS